MSDDELSAIESQIVKVILENRQLRAQNAELSKLNAQGERIGGMAINLCNSLAAIEDTLPAGARTDLMLLCGALHVISDPEGK